MEVLDFDDFDRLTPLRRLIRLLFVGPAFGDDSVDDDKQLRS
ncbi:hypothetical protein [Pseudomonas sp. ES3-33]|nr:hypothetical protein [Pseudomonas sp. ES3-33]